jgi:hypothetical protein
MSSYFQLEPDVGFWTNRTDLSAYIPSFVALFEAKANRELRAWRQETAFSGTIDGSNQLPLPADFLAFKTLWQPGQEGSPLTAQSLESVVARKRTTGAPTMYALDGGKVRFDGSGDILGTYHAAIPGLVANDTNWLSVQAYDAYLFGALSEAWIYLMDEQRAALYAARSDAALKSVIAADERDRFGGPLVARKR